MDTLKELIQLEKEARAFGFDWPNPGMILDQVISECDEINEVIHHRGSPERLQEEIGDLLHTAISLCLFCGFDVEESLSQVSRKFAGRMSALKTITQEHQLANLQGQSIEFMIALWEKAKERTHPPVK